MYLGPASPQGNTLTKSEPHRHAVTTSVGVNPPGNTVTFAFAANSTIATSNPGAVKKWAPASTHFRAVSVSSTVPAPTIIFSRSRTRWEINSTASCTVMVISTIGMPPWATASAAKCASSADETRIAGMIPIFLICSQTSALFMVEILIAPVPIYQEADQPASSREILHKLRFRLGQWIAFPCNPHVKRREQENTQQQRAHEAPHDHDRKRPLRI